MNPPVSISHSIPPQKDFPSPLAILIKWASSACLLVNE